MRVAALAVALSLVRALAGCQTPPDDVASSSFAWSIALSEIDEALLAVCADGDHVLAVGGEPGRAFALEYDGTTWREANLPGGSDLLWWCWVGADGGAYAVGENLTLLRREPDGSWRHDDVTGEPLPARTHLFGVWSAPNGVAYAVGGAFAPPGAPSLLLVREADGWRRHVPAGLPDQALFKVWGTAANDAWIVGAAGTLLHIGDAVALAPYPAPSPDRLIAVWGAGTDDVFAVGGDGRGVVYRFDGATWTNYADAPEELSGVWTAPGAPLYVGGARGYLARIDRATQATDVATPLPNVDIHNLAGGGDGAVFAAGRDLLSNGSPGWHGAVLTHNGSAGGDIDRRPPADAGPTDDTDAASPAPGPGPGKPCDVAGPALCADGLDCWQLLESDALVCTQSCKHALDCGDAYGPGACCARPGFQTLELVCIPAGFAECPAP